MSISSLYKSLASIFDYSSKNKKPDFTKEVCIPSLGKVNLSYISNKKEWNDVFNYNMGNK